MWSIQLKFTLINVKVSQFLGSFLTVISVDVCLNFKSIADCDVPSKNEMFQFIYLCVCLMGMEEMF